MASFYRIAMRARPTAHGSMVMPTVSSRPASALEGPELGPRPVQEERGRRGRLISPDSIGHVQRFTVDDSNGIEYEQWPTSAWRQRPPRRKARKFLSH